MAEDAYRAVRWTLPPGWSSREAFDRILWDLDKTSSPGFPMLREAPTTGQWLKWTASGPDPVQAERLWMMVREVLAGRYDHQYRVFVKDEPHKRAKAEEGRWRLIIASSLPVQVVWHMCFREMNNLLIRTVYQTPSFHGLVLCYGGWRRFLAEVQGLGLKVGKDLSAWDMNAPGWVFWTDLELRTRLCENPSDEWIRVSRWLYRDAFENSLLRFSNGYLYRQRFSGFMKSGVFNTIATNSASMFFLHVLACLRAGEELTPQIAVGDDTLQRSCSDAYLRELQVLGCKVKEVASGIEFVGTTFKRGRPEPLYFGKHLVSVATTAEVEATLDSFCRLYAHSDKLEFWVALARELGCKVRTPDYYRFWYDSPLARLL